MIVTSSPEMSIPISKAEVVASARNRPERSADSKARRSSGRKPPLYAATVEANSGASRSLSRVWAATASAPPRERTKVSRRASARISSAHRSEASVWAERR